ncbi:MAG TPA: PAS domain S-box protein, partial [Polyangiales bacterium]|nr:PAS domain S-box protein [Polyangiales bacterium]
MLAKIARDSLSMPNVDPVEPTPRPRFQSGTDEVPDALAIFTASDSPLSACIVYVNPAFEALSGYTAEQLLGHSSLLL